MRRVVIVAFPDVQSLDVAGPAEVFASAGDAYRVEVVAPVGGLVRATSGLGLWADCALADVHGPIDTLVVAGGEGTRQVAREVDEAVQAREVELVADAHDLLDAGDADARETDLHTGYPRLHVVAGTQRR